MKINKSLSEHQMAIMRVLWNAGTASVSEVHSALKAERDLAMTTVATMLTRLEKRGLVSHRVDGRQYHYRAEVSEQEVRQSMVRDLISRLFHGDPTALVSHLVRESELSERDLGDIQELIRNHEEDKPND